MDCNSPGVGASSVSWAQQGRVKTQRSKLQKMIAGSHSEGSLEKDFVGCRVQGHRWLEGVEGVEGSPRPSSSSTSSVSGVLSLVGVACVLLPSPVAHPQKHPIPSRIAPSALFLLPSMSLLLPLAPESPEHQPSIVAPSSFLVLENPLNSSTPQFLLHSPSFSSSAPVTPFRCSLSQTS